MRIRLVSIVIAALLIADGCREMTIQSVWENRTVAIDSEGMDWEDALIHLERVNTAVGFKNRADTFSMCVVPWNRNTQVLVAGNGCIVWFVRPENDKENIGVHFPLGDMEIAKKLADNLSKTEAVNLIRQLASQEKSIELINNHRKVICRLTSDEAREKGIQIALGEYNGRMMIEARMPFVFEVGGRKYDIRATQSTVEMQIETVLTDRREKETPEDAMSPPIGLAGSPYIRTDSRYTDPEEQTSTTFLNQLEISMIIQLAGNPQPDNGSNSE